MQERAFNWHDFGTSASLHTQAFKAQIPAVLYPLEPFVNTEYMPECTTRNNSITYLPNDVWLRGESGLRKWNGAAGRLLLAVAESLPKADCHYWLRLLRSRLYQLFDHWMMLHQHHHWNEVHHRLRMTYHWVLDLLDLVNLEKTSQTTDVNVLFCRFFDCVSLAQQLSVVKVEFIDNLETNPNLHGSAKKCTRFMTLLVDFFFANVELWLP